MQLDVVINSMNEKNKDIVMEISDSGNIFYNVPEGHFLCRG